MNEKLFAGRRAGRTVPKRVMVLFAACAVGALRASLTITAPEPGAVVPTLSPGQKAYLALPRAARVAAFADHAQRDAMCRLGDRPPPVRLAWRGGTGPYAVTVCRLPDGRAFLNARTTNSTMNVDNLEIARTYEVRVCGGGETALARFSTEDLAPRLLRVPGVSNARDFGGWKTLDGRRVKQGLAIRTAGLNGNARAKTLTPGRSNVSDETRAVLLRFLGVRSDIDLRSDEECLLMDGSPLGTGVRWFHMSSSAYGAMNTKAGRAAFSVVFRVFLDEANYPIDFHCIGGKDRTGSVAFILGALLGVPEEDLYRDWEATGFWLNERDFIHRTRFDHLVRVFDAFPGATLHARVEAYVKDLGFTDADLARFRAIMLEETGETAASLGLAADGSADVAAPLHAAFARGVREVRFGKGAYRLDGTLRLPSGTTLRADAEARFFAAPGIAPMWLVCNADLEGGNADIAIDGGAWDGNCDERPGKTFRPDEPHGGILFHFRNVKGLALSNLRAYDSVSYHFALGRVTDFTIRNVRIGGALHPFCQDGIHMGGGCARGHIDGVVAHTGGLGDDLIALNADDVYRYAWNRGQIDAPIRDITVENVVASNCYTVIRILSVHSPVERCVFRNFTGGFRCNGINLDAARYCAHPLFKSAERPAGVGCLNDILFENFDIWCVTGRQEIVTYETNGRNVRFRNFRHHPEREGTPTPNRPVLLFRNLGDAVVTDAGCPTRLARGQRLAIARPCLEDVRVDTDPADGTYKGVRCIDLSGQTNAHAFVRHGTKRDYWGHPTTALLADDKTVYCVYPYCHAGCGGFLSVSEDGGRHWRDVSGRLPAIARRYYNCPCLYRLLTPEGHGRLIYWQAGIAPDAQSARNACFVKKVSRDDSTAMPACASEDGGRSWRALEPLGPKFRNVLPFQGIVALKGRPGRYLGVYHRGDVGCFDGGHLEVLAATTEDGGLSWSDPHVIAEDPRWQLCEPWVFRAPDGKELCCLIRENGGTPSKVIFSGDEGVTWSKPTDAPWFLNGHRHQGIYLHDGRLAIVFRCVERKYGYFGQFIAWIGSYDALKSGRGEGSFHVKLIHNFSQAGDCGYAGIHQFQDGTVLATTYNACATDEKCSIVSIRFKVPSVGKKHD